MLLMPLTMRMSWSTDASNAAQNPVSTGRDSPGGLQNPARWQDQIRGQQSTDQTDRNETRTESSLHALHRTGLQKRSQAAETNRPRIVNLNRIAFDLLIG